MDSLVREIKKLTNELETERERRRNETPIDYTIATNKYKQVIKENQKLKDQLDALDQECGSRMNKEQESELLKENKALQEQNESLHIIATEGARKGIEKSKEIAKLKAENKQLKEELDVWVNPTGDVVMNREAMMLYEASQEEIEELKEEIKILKSYNHKLFEGEGV